MMRGETWRREEVFEPERSEGAGGGEEGEERARWEG